VFTKTGEFATPIWSTGALTPTNVDLRLQTSNGSELTQPIILDNQTMYVKRGGRAVMSFSYVEGSTGYTSVDLSVMSSHLIKDPVDMASYTVNDAYDSNVLFMIDDDGNMVFYESLSEQNVSAWCNSSTYTGDKWLNVAAVEDRAFFIVKRGANYLLEELNWNIVMDCGTKKTIASTGSQTVALGATYDSRTVVAVTDIGDDSANPTGSYIGEYTADSSGNITVDIPKTGDYWFGLKFPQIIKTMPAHVLSQEGDTLYTKKKINKVYVQYYNSYTFRVNGLLIPMDILATGTPPTGLTLDSAVQPKTGVYATPSITLGWARTTYVTCIQDIPLPVNILGISVQLSV
jgi:hypothetical protein